MPESSPAAWRFAMRARAYFCRLSSGLLNIDSALALISFARRDDADDFFVIVVFTVYPTVPPKVENLLRPKHQALWVEREAQRKESMGPLVVPASLQDTVEQF